MEVKQLNRKFIFNEKELADPNPNMTPSEVIKFYSGTYAELINCTIKGPKIDTDTITYEFVTSVGVKG